MLNICACFPASPVMYDGYVIIPNGRPTWAPLLAASGQQLAVSIRSPTNHASWTCYVYRHLFAAGRPSRVGPYAQGRWPCFLRIAELWQPTFISSPVCDIVGDAQRAYRYGNSAKCYPEKTLFADRRSQVAVSRRSIGPLRRGRPVKASRYALRASRSVVVSLSLSRRNAAF